MREIKFRAWNSRMKIMTVFGNAPVVGQYPVGEDELYWGMMFATDDVTVPLSGYDKIMQSIGQTDQDGREIYEGDILTATVDRAKYFATETFVVEYLDGAFQLINPNDSSEGYFWIDVLDNSAKVIGNIHENPELLRQD